jgi:hypothetical protein
MNISIELVICKVLGIAYIAFSGPQSPPHPSFGQSTTRVWMCVSFPRNSSNFKKEKSGLIN